MNSIELSMVRRIVPELLETLRARTRILARIRLLQPIGRRALATEMDTTERVLRAEVEFLRQQGLLIAGPAGMSLSEEGHDLLDELEAVLAEMEGRSELAASLSRMLHIPKVIVVVGDSDEETWVKETLGLQAGIYLRSALQSGDVVAVTGGSTMATMAQMMPRRGSELKVHVVPARGGLGESSSVQANTIAEELARAVGGTHGVLHIPDRISEQALERLKEDPLVQEGLRQIREASVVVHGIGGAVQMAERRRMDDAEVAELKRAGAVAEAFGYYFDEGGQTVLTMNTVGLKLDDLAGVRLVVGVAGGQSKAAAIVAAAGAYRMDVLITDEGAAQAMLRHAAADGLTAEAGRHPHKTSATAQTTTSTSNA